MPACRRRRASSLQSCWLILSNIALAGASGCASGSDKGEETSTARGDDGTGNAPEAGEAPSEPDGRDVDVDDAAAPSAGSSTDNGASAPANDGSRVPAEGEAEPPDAPGEVTNPDPNPADDGGGDEDAGGDESPLDGLEPLDPLQSDSGELVIPQRVQSESELMYFLLPEDDVAGDGLAASEVSMTLLWGDEYPKDVQLTLGGGFVITGSESEATFETVTSDNPDIEGSLLGEQVLALHTSATGTALLTLEGTWQDGAQGTIGPARLAVTVLVVELGGVQWRSCSSPSTVLSGHRPRSSSFAFADLDGNEIQRPLNVDSRRPVTVTVRAGATGTTMSTSSGIGALVVEGPEQTVSVEGPFGPLSGFDLIHPGRIDGVDVDYFLCAPWTRGGTVESGETVRIVPDTGNAFIEVAPYATVDGLRICSEPEADLFTLSSLTEETCPLSADNSCVTASGSALPLGGSVERAGSCELQVAVPEGNSGAGAVDEFAVEFVERE